MISLQHVSLDMLKRKVKVEGKQVILNPREYDILLLLSQHVDMVMPIEQIYEQVWKEQMLSSYNTVMVHIRKIREKIEHDPKRPTVIQTVWEWGIKQYQGWIKMWKTKVGLSGLFIFYMMVSLGVSLICAVLGGKMEIDSLTRYYYPTRYQLEEQLKQYVLQLEKKPITEWNSLLTKYAAQSQSNLFIMNDKSHIFAYSSNFQELSHKSADYISLSTRNNEEPSNHPVKRTFYAF